MNLAQLSADAKQSPAHLASLQEAQDLVQHLSQELRTTSYLLHPPMLDESGLSYALQWYVQGLAERSELNIDLKIPENFERLSPELELVVFRLVQECLTNIHRHSGSKTALIRVDREEDKIHVVVQDHGRGMSPERFAEVRSQGTGVGIRGMRERVRQVHGELTIESNALGTKISAIFPAQTPYAKGPREFQQLGVAQLRNRTDSSHRCGMGFASQADSDQPLLGPSRDHIYIF
jgi:signal transduction histidine kinase